MVKRLVVCCDGTWNTPDQNRDGTACRTNVAKLAMAVAERDRAGTEQRLAYIRGVGTSRWERVRGGAFGVGLSRNVKEAYRFIAQAFEPGDEIFLFGFSRGAYTARSTAGLIRNAGLLKRQHLDRLEEAYRLYRDRSSATHPRATESRLFRRSFSRETRIRFIGVWDTVGALGIPVRGPAWANAFNTRWRFHDTELSGSVDGAFHALAIDERRRPFEPTLWRRGPAGDAGSQAPAEEAGGQRLEQVWFSGAHGDVGGGYPQSGLSDIALRWMAQRAGEYGRELDLEALGSAPANGADPVRPDPFGALHDSMSAVYRLQGPLIRPMGGDPQAHESAASTAVQRLDRDPGYGPANLVDFLGAAGVVSRVD